eukprot:CAMPEP_0183577306 /NCGR_PEP_ID=MMETSP0371-20130417/139540_1 /TAXON_ID=268820 /ORGANISM="Peridinium aciculiferum, Strain PAER-2" /LENGTH=340 /DNA_ID=CAMNT_0025787631 /DNA_START=38 /DNA_END=1061 /DNA_ORIENTATION=-
MYCEKLLWRWSVFSDVFGAGITCIVLCQAPFSVSAVSRTYQAFDNLPDPVALLAKDGFAQAASRSAGLTFGGAVHDMATHAAAIVAVTRAIRIQVTTASLADELLQHADVCVPRKFYGRLGRSRLALPFVFHCHVQVEPNHLQARQGPAGEHTLGQEAFIEDAVICLLGLLELGSLQFQYPLRILSLPSFMHDDVRGHPVQGALVGTPGGGIYGIALVTVSMWLPPLLLGVRFIIVPFIVNFCVIAGIKDKYGIGESNFVTASKSVLCFVCFHNQAREHVLLVGGQLGSVRRNIEVLPTDPGCGLALDPEAPQCAGRQRRLEKCDIDTSVQYGLPLLAFG